VLPTARAASRRGCLPAVYRVWLVGALVSQLGDAALYFALGWAASGIGGPAAGLVLSAIALPRTALLLLGGVVGDRAGAARVLIAGDGVMLVVAVVLGLVAYAWPTPLAVLLAAGLIIGTVDAFYLPSLGSMPRRLVGDEQLRRAVAVRQSGSQLVTMVGGPLGGAVVAIAGVAAAAWVDAASFAVVLVVLVAIRRRIVVVATSRRTESVLAAARDGVRICRQTPGLGVALLLAAGAAGFVIPSTSLLVPLLARHNHWSASTAGLMVGAQGLGVIVSALVVARRGGARRPGIAAVGGLATAAIGQTLVAVIPSSGLVVVAAVLIGLGSGTFVANLAPVLLGAVPRTHLARVQSLLSVVQSSALLVTNNLLGAITHWASAPIAMMCCAGGLATCVVVALTRPTLRHLGGPGAAPSDRSDG
jgi:MFS family permease